MQRLQNIQGHLNPLSSQPKYYGKTYKFTSVGSLKGKTILISGASRGIGLAIGKRAAKDGANIVILAKTAEPHPKLPGTIYTAAEEIRKLGGQALPIICDIRFEDQVKKAVEKAVQTFGGIDIVINNASAINFDDAISQDMKKYDLMHNINLRGTFLVSKYTLPHLLKAKNPHILIMSPPINLNPHWFEGKIAYTIAKYGMSMCVLGLSQEYRDAKIAVNALWPKTAIATAAVQNVLAGDEGMKKCRTDEIMADSAYVILTNDSKELTGQFFIDEDVLRSVGVTDFTKYKADPKVRDEDLMPDLYVE